VLASSCPDAMLWRSFRRAWRAETDPEPPEERHERFQDLGACVVRTVEVPDRWCL